MTRKGIAGRTQDEIVEQIASFALYGFPESHAASFALIAYASAYLKCHYLAAFTAATLNNQPMGFYQPFTIIKDAQRHGLKVLPVDVTRSKWECTVESSEQKKDTETGGRKDWEKDRSQKSEVRGPKQDAETRGRGDAENREQKSEVRSQESEEERREQSPRGEIFEQSRRGEIFIDNGDPKFVEAPLGATEFRSYGVSDQSFQPRSINIQPIDGCEKIDSVLNVISNPLPTTLHPPHPALRLGLLCVKGLREEAGRAIVRAREYRSFTSIDDLHQRVPELRKDELRKLAAVGALNRIEKVEGRRQKAEGRGQRPEVRDQKSKTKSQDQRAKIKEQSPNIHRRDALWQVERVSRDPGPLYETLEETGASPLQAMDLNERLNADLRGTGITIGRHPMAHQRAWLDTMKVTPAGQLKSLRNGMWVKVAGWVIVRQRPGTAKGFVFLSMEDETGIANVIVTPQLFETNRLALVNYPFLLIEGVLQHQDNVVSVKARKIEPLQMKVESTGSHDFH
jgi:DNA polymerase III alpha subunit